MDVLVLIDKLDDTIHNAKPVPLTDQVRVDKEEIYDILDQMRATIPEEIKQARWIEKKPKSGNRPAQRGTVGSGEDSFALASVGGLRPPDRESLAAKGLHRRHPPEGRSRQSPESRLATF